MSSNPREDSHHRGPTGQEIIIGRVVSVNIPRREIRVFPETSHPERFHKLRDLCLKTREGRMIRLIPAGFRVAGSNIVVKIETDDEDELALARNALVVISREERISLPDNEYYVDDLIGLVVKDRAGAVIGRLSEVLETPANDIYQVIDDKGNEILVPAVENFIISVNIEAGEMTVDVSNLI